MTLVSAPPREYLPAAGRHLFLPLYDPLTRWMGLNRVRKPLIEQASLTDGQHVLHVGCGTGTLLLELARRHPGVVAFGVDPDARALARARRKAERARSRVRFEQGFAEALQYRDQSFDRALSSFIFNHLAR